MCALYDDIVHLGFFLPHSYTFGLSWPTYECSPDPEMYSECGKVIGKVNYLLYDIFYYRYLIRIYLQNPCPDPHLECVSGSVFAFGVCSGSWFAFKMRVRTFWRYNRLQVRLRVHLRKLGPDSDPCSKFESWSWYRRESSVADSGCFIPDPTIAPSRIRIPDTEGKKNTGSRMLPLFV
jgi:hypothetical protein